MLGPRQPSEVEQHAIHLAGLHQLPQLRMVVEHRTPHLLIPGVGQALVRAVHRLLLDIHGQHTAVLPGQTAQKQRVVSVAAGRIEIQPAGGHMQLQKLMAQLHSGQIRHTAAHQPPALRHKVEPPRQSTACLVPGQGRGEACGLFRVQPAAAPQQLLYQIAAVAAPAPRGHDLQTQDRSAVHHSRTNGFALLI